MQRFILTGAPGAGKTALLRRLERDGFPVVEEAATDVIALEQAMGTAEPWTDPGFADRIAALQGRRLELSAALPGPVQFHDRSVICTLALAEFLSHPVSTNLEQELARVLAAQIFDRRVFFIELLGFITPTEARRIGYADALRFAEVHERAYRRYGFELVRIAPASIADRAATIRRLL